MEYLTIESQAIDLVASEMWNEYINCEDIDEFADNLGI
jgi:hypothetical protein